MTLACAAAGGCVFPSTCDAASKTCTDPLLPTLLTAAQTTAKALYDEYMPFIYNLSGGSVSNYRNVVANYISAITNLGEVTFMGTSVVNLLTPLPGFSARAAVSLNAIQSAATAALVPLNEYAQRVLAAPGCAPSAAAPPSWPMAAASSRRSTLASRSATATCRATTRWSSGAVWPWWSCRCWVWPSTPGPSPWGRASSPL